MDLGFDLRVRLRVRLCADSGEGRSLTSSDLAHLGTVTQRILEHITLTQQAATHVDSLLGDPRLVGGGQGGGEGWVVRCGWGLGWGWGSDGLHLPTAW